jgi:hypothetical protein
MGPIAQIALNMILQMPAEQKLAIVSTVAQTLGVTPGFWSAEKVPPNRIACLVQLELPQGGAAYAVASHCEDGTWVRWGGDEVLASAVRRWAVIPE